MSVFGRAGLVRAGEGNLGRGMALQVNPKTAADEAFHGMERKRLHTGSKLDLLVLNLCPHNNRALSSVLLSGICGGEE